VRRLYAEGHSKSAIARQLGISRTSVRRFIG
jgi:DNA-binding transcriptional regulator LsrR (DeoR family)